MKWHCQSIKLCDYSLSYAFYKLSNFRHAKRKIVIYVYKWSKNLLFGLCHWHSIEWRVLHSVTNIYVTVFLQKLLIFKMPRQTKEYFFFSVKIDIAKSCLCHFLKWLGKLHIFQFEHKVPLICLLTIMPNALYLFKEKLWHFSESHRK